MPESPNPKLREAPLPAGPAVISSFAYAELDVKSNFSFLRGASHPDEMVYRAAELGYRAIAITDFNSVAGVVRAHRAAKEASIKLLVGSRLTFSDAPDLLVWATDRAAYATLCRLLTLGKRRAEKGQCALMLEDFLKDNDGLLAALVSASELDQNPKSETRNPKQIQMTKFEKEETQRSEFRHSDFGLDSDFEFRISDFRSPHLSPPPEYREREKIPLKLSFNPLSALRDAIGSRLSLAVSCAYGSDDIAHLSSAAELSRRFGIPLLATNDVYYHDPSRRMLQDVLTCVRHGCTIRDAGFRLFSNAERYLKPPEKMHRLFADYPQAINRGIEVAEACNFSLEELRYEYPSEVVPEGKSALEHLADLTWRGAAVRYPTGVPEKVRKLIEHELEMVRQLQFEHYFLTVQDLVTFARSRGILCQGRGSAANSAVCYCIGVTSVDPDRIDVLFERFISSARGEPPDIDVDFEHERREEVIQYVYEKYGRQRAGMTAEVITYRGRSAVRDVGKAMGLEVGKVDALAGKLDWWHSGSISDEQARESGLDPADHTTKLIIDLTTQLLGFPRHLSQHVGGMVMTRGPLCEMVPIENASMEGRTVIEWDKDDIDELRILKVDVLALGMLTCISKAFKLVDALHGHQRGTGAPPVIEFQGCLARGVDEQKTRAGRPCYEFTGEAPVLHSGDALVRRLELHTIPPEDPLVYDMIDNADTIGVFQIESRAQMTMLPRLRPRCFYDLVIEVAIVRPGPIQGDMVHPYLRRRQGLEPVEYPSEELRQVLGKTLGVPLFQEQAMRLVMVAASFSAEQADKLRRAMAAWRRNGVLEQFHPRVVEGMVRNGYNREFAERCFQQIRGFGEYGFPESHAASFALLVYASAWLKCHYPAVFAAALLNSQPMGFYAPAQIVRDAKDHGVQVRPVDVNESEWDCTLEGSFEGSGFRVQGSGAQGQRDKSTREQGEINCHVERSEAPGISEQGSQHDHSVGSASRTVETYERSAMRTLHDPALRLGFRQIKGFREAYAKSIVTARPRAGRFTSMSQFHQLTRLPVSAIRLLAQADAFGSLGLTRRQAMWQATTLKNEEFPLFENRDGSGISPPENPEPSRFCAADGSSSVPLFSDERSSSVPLSEPAVRLPAMPLGQEVAIDYATTGMSLKRHPVDLVREQLSRRGILCASQMLQKAHGQWVKVAGLVLVRQRPGTASGVVFVTIEDESGVVNLILHPTIYERFRPAARHARLLQADGYVQRDGQVVHVLAKRLFDVSDLLADLEVRARDFH